MIKVPNLQNSEDVGKYIMHLLDEMETLVTTSMRLQERYEDLLSMYRIDLEKIKHYEQIIWGKNNEEY